MHSIRQVHAQDDVHTIHPSPFSIQHSALKKGPDGCAGSQPGPQTVKNWLFPGAGIPDRKRNDVTLDSRFPADNLSKVVPGLREGPGPVGSGVFRDRPSFQQLTCQTPLAEDRGPAEKT